MQRVLGPSRGSAECCFLGGGLGEAEVQDARTAVHAWRERELQRRIDKVGVEQAARWQGLDPCDTRSASVLCSLDVRFGRLWPSAALDPKWSEVQILGACKRATLGGGDSGSDGEVLAAVLKFF